MSLSSFQMLYPFAVALTAFPRKYRKEATKIFVKKRISAASDWLYSFKLGQLITYSFIPNIHGACCSEYCLNSF